MHFRALRKYSHKIKAEIIVLRPCSRQYAKITCTKLVIPELVYNFKFNFWFIFKPYFIFKYVQVEQVLVSEALITTLKPFKNSLLNTENFIF